MRVDWATYESTMRMFIGGVGDCASFSSAPNALYGPAGTAGCVAAACAGNANVASAASALRYAGRGAGAGGSRVPCGGWLRRAVSGTSPGEAVEAFNRSTGRIVAMLREKGLLGGKLDVAIDFHNIRRHDRKPGPEIVRGGDKKARTKEFYETYATVQCVAAGQRITLGMLPYTAGGAHAGSVAGLLDVCRMHGLEVGLVLLDRGFYSTAVFSLLQASGHRWLMPCPNSLHVKEALAGFEAGRRKRVSGAAITHAHGDECGYTMVIAPRRARRGKAGDGGDEPWEKHIAFATSDPGIDVEEYSKRWGIETAYRQLEGMRARTRTRAHGPRVAYLALTMILFNAWIVVDALHRLACAPRRTRPSVKLRSALEVMLKVLRTGPGPPA